MIPKPTDGVLRLWQAAILAEQYGHELVIRSPDGTVADFFEAVEATEENLADPEWWEMLAEIIGEDNGQAES